MCTMEKGRDYAQSFTASGAIDWDLKRRNIVKYLHFADSEGDILAQSAKPHGQTGLWLQQWTRFRRQTPEYLLVSFSTHRLDH